MPETRVDVVVESPVPDTPRARQLEGMFDVPRAQVSRLEWHTTLDLDARPWHVGLIVGPSGAGKTRIAEHVFGPHVPLDWDAPSVVDAFAPGLSMEQIARICQAVGFNTIPAWLRPYDVLSTGEQFRVDLARRMLELPDPVVVDEFSSVVDRQVAQIGSHAVQKYVRAHDRRFIAVTCHFDVVDWLQPDWVLEPASMSFTWRSLQRRPPLDVAVAHVPHAYWRLFAPFHYLTSELHRAATCFVLFVGDRPAAFAGLLHRPHKTANNIKGISRLVTLPDWQGLGLAFVLADTIAGVYQAYGWRVRTYPAHPALVHSFDRSRKWTLKQRPLTAQSNRRTSRRRDLPDPAGRTNRTKWSDGWPQGRRLPADTEQGSVPAQGARPNAVFEWAGQPLPLDQAQQLLADVRLPMLAAAG